jgi:hypothetical protein
MSVAANETPTSNQQDTHEIPTQRISSSGIPEGKLIPLFAFELSDSHKVDISAVRDRVEREKIIPASVAVLREVFLQVSLDYPRDSFDTEEQLDAFTNRAILTHQLYEGELLDEESPTGLNREKHGEVIERAEEFDDTKLLASMNDVLTSQWVKDNPTKVRSFTIEAYAIACLMTLDAHGVELSFMKTDETTSETIV